MALTEGSDGRMVRVHTARQPLLGSLGLLSTLYALACGAGCPAQELPAAETVPLAVEALHAPTAGASWVILQWRSPAQRFDVLWGESGPERWRISWPAKTFGLRRGRTAARTPTTCWSTSERASFPSG